MDDLDENIDPRLLSLVNRDSLSSRITLQDVARSTNPLEDEQAPEVAELANSTLFHPAWQTIAAGTHDLWRRDSGCASTCTANSPQYGSTQDFVARTGSSATRVSDSLLGHALEASKDVLELGIGCELSTMCSSPFAYGNTNQIGHQSHSTLHNQVQPVQKSSTINGAAQRPFSDELSYGSTNLSRLLVGSVSDKTYDIDLSPAASSADHYYDMSNDAAIGIDFADVYDIGIGWDIFNSAQYPGPSSQIVPPTTPSRRTSAPSLLMHQPDVSSSRCMSELGLHPDPLPATKRRRHSDRAPFKPRLSSALTFIAETGAPGTTKKSRPLHMKGGRSGPLSMSCRENANRCRKDKSICIRCRKDRQPCDATLGVACSNCVHLGLTATWQQPCTPAWFLSVVESGTCNYISQRSVNHLKLDHSGRVRIELPATLDLDKLLGTLRDRRNAFDIRVRQESGSLFVLRLDKCLSYLSAIRSHQPRSDCDMRQFIDHDILKSDAWQGCVDECDPVSNIMGCLLTWSNMPSRATYSYVTRGEHDSSEHVNGKDMDVELDEGREDIILAAQLARIICRKLEVDAYDHIQRLLNQWTNIEAGELVSKVRELGLLLLTLRWRVSWWTLLGDGGMAPDPVGKAAFENRVNTLCRQLYFYYCMLRRKIPSWTASDDLNGVQSTYADTSNSVFDDFPGDESADGFENWMKTGRDLIVQAGVAKKLSGYGPRCVSAL